MLALCASIEVPLKSPFLRLHHWFALNFYRDLSSANKLKDELISAHLNATWDKFAGDRMPTGRVQAAIDVVVEKEIEMAKQEGRPVAHNTQDIRDELFGILVAGHDTTAMTVSWGLKFLTENQRVQQHLRTVLEGEFQRAEQEGDNPSAVKIAATSIPYLDAVIEEIHRCACTVPSLARMTMA